MHRWKFSVLAAAAVALTGFHADDAYALALGRITVQSALGEPLRAEIDLPQITPAEADTLRATTASPEVFRAQGMEFNPAVNNLRMQLQRRPDGTAVTAHAAWFARALGREVRVYHAVVFADKARPVVADTFFAGLELR